MKNILKEYAPDKTLNKYVDAFWFFRNTTGKEINFPVVPDGCSDIIFYLNDSVKQTDLSTPFISGVMEVANIIPIPAKMELFGIRFKPGILSYILKYDMNILKNKKSEFKNINKNIFNDFSFEKKATDNDIVLSMSSKLCEILQEDIINDDILDLIEMLCKNPDISIRELSLKSNCSQKSLERAFNKKVGIPPKKLTRIIRFQMAHKLISKEGLTNLIEVALSSGYFDQAHFNHEYKKLVGFNPSNETMSIFYNT